MANADPSTLSGTAPALRGGAAIVAIVMAAGQGTRMKSNLPKVLHPLLGRPMLSYPIQAALDAGVGKVVVVLGHGRAQVEAELRQRFDARVVTAVQPEQRGTGDAARCGANAVPDHQGLFLIFNGDAPLLTAHPLQRLIEVARGSAAPLAMLTAHLDGNSGYGRILRDLDGNVVAIRELKDCSVEEASIRELNPGVYAIDAGFFRNSVTLLTTANKQGELLLTDMVAVAAAQSSVADVPWDAAELEGINDRYELAARERDLRMRRGRQLALQGVTVRHPESTFIDTDVTIAEDVVIEPQVHLRGACVIERGVHIGVGCVLQDVHVSEGARLFPYCVATSSQIGESARVGPFSHMRPESRLEAEAHIGNFVETKKTVVGRGSKANHLAYLGDGVIGAGVNVGAGTIFCNYDGFGKHRTTLEDGAFIGSDSQLVAPVTVGKDAYVVAGTTVTESVPARALAIGRAAQVNKPELGARLREKLKAQADKAKAGPK
jgi:bifunctional UDP-N-acetylglucosamine pyrophosphorylase/glucosamine-1-phosphate N-acetyltransferase